jgi:RNA polymerase sigma factor (sigma-70 family)
MSRMPRGMLMEQIQRLFQIGTASGLSEWQLLRRYLVSKDEAAFEALVARHGTAVLGVCRRILRDPHEIEDAFQATFLVLVRRAGALRERDAIGPWLYGVAYKVALRARATSSRRRDREPSCAELELNLSAPESDPGRFELGEVLDQELSRLPQKYRAPVVLCYLEGQTHEEAARSLGWPVGTVKGRLVRARETLRHRLTRRGLVLSTTAVVAAITVDATATVPDVLLEKTVRLAIEAGAGRTAGHAVSASLHALTQGVLTTMFLHNVRTAALVGAVLVLAVGAGAVAQKAIEAEKPDLKATAKTAPPPPDVEPAAPAPAADKMERVDAESAHSPARAAAPSPSPVSKLIRRAFLEALAAYKEGKIDASRVYLWSERLLDADDNDPENIHVRRAAFQAHLERMKDLRRAVQMRASSGHELPLTVTEAEYYRHDAADRLANLDKGETPAPQANRRPASSTPPPEPAANAAPPPTAPATATISAAPHVPNSRGNDALSRAVLAELEKPIDMQFGNETPLDDVLKYIRESTKGPKMVDGIPIYVDPLGLQEAEKTMQSTVILDLRGIPLRTTLSLALRQLGLTYIVEEGILYITSDSSADTHLPNALTTASPIVEMQEQAERGELDEAGIKTLIEKLKARNEVAKLMQEYNAVMAPPKAAAQKPAKPQ